MVDVIDVWYVVAHSLWMLGLAILVAALSWAHWAAGVAGCGLRDAVRRPAVRRGIEIGLVFFGAGMGATGRHWWEQGLWWLLAAVWVVQIWKGCLAKRNRPPRKQGR